MGYIFSIFVTIAGTRERGGAGEWREVEECNWDIGEGKEASGGNARYATGR